jgi:hypothetical protein
MLVFLLGRSERLLANGNIKMPVDCSYVLDGESGADERRWCSARREAPRRRFLCVLV